MTNEEWQNWNTEKAIDYSVEAVKAALLLNGGGAVAMLTLLGAVVGKEGGSVLVDLEPLKATLQLLSLGMSCAAATFVVAYLAQRAAAGHNYFLQQGPQKRKAATRCHWSAVALQLAGLILIGSSLGLFGYGVFRAPSAFTKSAPKERSIEFTVKWPTTERAPPRTTTP